MGVPRYASSADLLVGRFGRDYYFIRDTNGPKQLGRALYAARPLAAGTIIAKFSGEVLHSSEVQTSRRCASHMLRIPGSDLIVDGRPVANSLVRVPREPACWQPSRQGRWAHVDVSYACMANSTPKHIATAEVRFVCDDTGAGVRPDGFVPTPGNAVRLCVEAERVLPRAAYLVTRRNLRAGEEITWHYQVALH